MNIIPVLGVIKKQAFQSSVLLYAGVIIGFITTGLLAPNLLGKSEIGTLKLLQSYSAIFMGAGVLGFSTVTLRFVPHFFDQIKHSYNGFVGISMLIGAIGSMVAVAFILGIKPSIVENNIEKSPQFAQYFFLIIPLTIFQIFYTLFDSYNNALYRSSFGVFLRDFVQRILILAGLFLVFLNIFDFGHYIYYYTVAICLPTVLILLNLVRHKAFDVRINLRFLNRPLISSMASVGLFGLLNSFSGIAVLQIDTIMLNAFMDSDAVGIYAITFYFGALVLIPSKALNKIAPTSIAKAFKDNDLEVVKDIYYKSAGNLFLIGTLILLGLAVNLENIFSIIPESYKEGRYVILLIGLANLIKMGAGSNDSVITYSKYYKMTTVFLILLVALLALLNILFIPLYGITGAAIASCIAILAHNLIKYFFIRIRFGFNPYNYQYLLIVALAGVVYFVVSLLPDIKDFIAEIILDSICSIILYYLAIRFLPLAKESDQFGRQLISNAVRILRSKIK